jgi:hypothetical protein
MEDRALLWTALSDLRVDDEQWRMARLRTIQRARQLTNIGVRVADICTVLGISQATWFRRCQELDAALSEEGKAQMIAEHDQAFAGILDVEVHR